jgi:hypothetical protein
MNKNKRLLLSLLFTTLFFLVGCEKNPLNKLINPDNPVTSGTWGNKWTLYDDEFKTGGALYFFTTMDGQTFDANCENAPYSGRKCIRYSWDGRPVTAYSTMQTKSDYAGFGLMVADEITKYPTSAAQNISNINIKDLSNYNRISFRARGSLANNVYLRVEGNSNDSNFYARSSGYPGVWVGQVSDQWQQFSFDLSISTNSLATAKDYVKVVLVYDEDGDSHTANHGQGNGGTIYLDDICLEKVNQ